MSGRSRLLLSLFAASLILGTSQASAQVNADAGTAGFAFLKIQQNARVVAMGSASVADATDAAAFQLNPAGLAQQRQRTWTASYANLFTDVQSGFLAYSQPLEAETVVGVALTYLTSGNIPKRSVLNEDEGTYGFSDLAFTLSAGTRLVGGPDTIPPDLRRRMRLQTTRLDGGISVRGIYEKLDDLSASGVAVDLGLLAHLPDDRTSVGLAVTNLGAQTSGFVDAKDEVPWALVAGFRHALREAPLVAVGDITMPSDNKVRFGAGAEFRLGGGKSRPAPLALRAGYHSQGRDLKTTADDSGLAGFSFGLGMLWRAYGLDYSFTPGVGLGTLHRFTLSGQLP